MNKNQKTIQFYGTKWISTLPFIVFVVTLLALAVNRASSQDLLMGVTLLAICVTAVFAKDKHEFWNTLYLGMTKKSVAIFTLIFTLVGIFATLLSAGKVAGGIIWLASILHIKGSLFVGFTFLAAAVLSTGSGSSMATVLTLGPALYPAGIILGANPFILAGALVSGANFGDTLAPVSDATIAATGGQFYKKSGNPVEIGQTVKKRFKYAVVAGILTLGIFMLIGGGGSYLSPEQANALIAEHSYAKGLLMLIPVLIIIYLSVNGKPIAQCLSYGIFVGAGIALAFGLLVPSDIVGFELVNSKVVISGIIPKGVVKMIKIIIIMNLLMGSGQLLLNSGVMHSIMEKLGKLTKTPRSAEIVMVLLSSTMGLLGGFSVMGIAVAGPFVDAIGKEKNIHPYRRANFLSTCTASICHFVPWSSQLFVLTGFITSMQGTFPFIPNIATTDYFLYCIHPWLLPLVMLVVAITGWGRIFEKEDGSVIKAYYSNDVPLDIAQ
ncbi:hypothetical protein EZV73_07935 [Acidaminobacter sp. JC074]|uniref:Na+/H+ antiporter NhaC family protein n=1 Tax=Acidaminobacter sp. JC074 TaxID=2530199 RepID=UPI001F0D8F55|nr:Na+/H+ antiporter NhaC family protein [Acidaminobacter sp. JC074]MCH4887497.1 hypothetical protein [Acidaminobacter sp. JC074]